MVQQVFVPGLEYLDSADRGPSQRLTGLSWRLRTTLMCSHQASPARKEHLAPIPFTSCDGLSSDVSPERLPPYTQEGPRLRSHPTQPQDHSATGTHTRAGLVLGTDE